MRRLRPRSTLSIGAGLGSDSRIAAGLFLRDELARELKADLLFLTDGQEAPPLPPSGPPPFEGLPENSAG